MLSSDLKDRITIQKKTNTSNDFGEVIQNWFNVNTVSAKAVFNGGNRIFKDEIVLNIFDVEFFIRVNRDINYNCRILFKSDIYIIQQIEPLGERGRDGFRIKCKRSETDG